MVLLRYPHCSSGGREILELDSPIPLLHELELKVHSEKTDFQNLQYFGCPPVCAYSHSRAFRSQKFSDNFSLVLYVIARFFLR